MKKKSPHFPVQAVKSGQMVTMGPDCEIRTMYLSYRQNEPKIMENALISLYDAMGKEMLIKLIRVIYR
jgi:hypothetical protein